MGRVESADKAVDGMIVRELRIERDGLGWMMGLGVGKMGVLAEKMVQGIYGCD